NATFGRESARRHQSPQRELPENEVHGETYQHHLRWARKPPGLARPATRDHGARASELVSRHRYRPDRPRAPLVDGSPVAGESTRTGQSIVVRHAAGDGDDAGTE